MCYFKWCVRLCGVLRLLCVRLLQVNLGYTAKIITLWNWVVTRYVWVGAELNLEAQYRHVRSGLHCIMKPAIGI
jgi:hypothetical protein